MSRVVCAEIYVLKRFLLFMDCLYSWDTFFFLTKGQSDSLDPRSSGPAPTLNKPTATLRCSAVSFKWLENGNLMNQRLYVQRPSVLTGFFSQAFWVIMQREPTPHNVIRNKSYWCSELISTRQLLLFQERRSGGASGSLSAPSLPWSVEKYCLFPGSEWRFIPRAGAAEILNAV